MAARIGLWILLVGLGVYRATAGAAESAVPADDAAQATKMLLGYYQQMCVPKPLTVRTGEAFETRRQELKKRLLAAAGLWPLPERIALDVHQSPPLDHPWCTVRRVHYQLWPGVYASGLLFMPKELAQRPAPAVLCPHGHWTNGNAHPEVQRRCLNLARLGYVTFSSTQNHYEDLMLGVSHQTLMIWNNLRALDYLESLSEVDRQRIGVAGASGGGLQAQMVVAVDGRVRAATIVGLTCDFREIMFPNSCHCACNHFPGVMRFTDHPEISVLGLPAAVQYLTMNDWTRTFERANFPAIRALYAAHGVGDRVDCQYFSTEHSYDQPKREATYRWLDRWLAGKHAAEALREPADSRPFAVEALTQLTARVAGDKGFGEISRIYRRTRGYQPPAIATAADWRSYRERMTAALGELLGEAAVLPRVQRSHAWPRSVRTEGELQIEQAAYASEGEVVLPAIVVRRIQARGKLPVVVMCSADGKETLVREQGPGSAMAMARAGSLVVLPDVRFTGVFSWAGKPNERSLRQAWERNGIVWGRPVPGLAATDLRSVLDGIASRTDADMAQLSLIARKSAELGIAAIFAAVPDRRIAAVDVDLEGRCFEQRNLPLVSGVLQQGDVPQWAALLADRKLTLRNAALESGPRSWLSGAFSAMGNRSGLRIQADR